MIVRSVIPSERAIAMARCKCSCGREVATPATGRPGEYYSASCRKRAQRQRERAVQLELALESDGTFVDEEALPSGEPPVEVEPDGTKLPEPAGDPQCWTVYSREDLHDYDTKRRVWLREWAQARDYPPSWFTLYGKYSGYYKTGILPGKEGWARFLEHGG